MAIEKAVSAKNVALRKLLERSGIPLDHRQDERSLKFATFPVYDHGKDAGLSDLAVALKEHFIKSAAQIEFHSKARQITFSPVLSELGPPFEGAKISYLRSEDAIHIKYGLDPKNWISAKGKARRRLLVEALVESLQSVRPNWLTEADKQVLIPLFSVFAK